MVVKTLYVKESSWDKGDIRAKQTACGPI